MSLSTDISIACKTMGQRLYHIHLPGTGRSWKTTDAFAALKFTHMFGFAGFNMHNRPYEGKPIPEIQMDYETDIIKEYQKLLQVVWGL